jgi:site-specific DNA recombinase
MNPLNQQIKKLVAAYYRVSTSNQEEHQTIQTQVLAVKEFAEKNGYEIVQEYKDDGWSGDILARPDLDQLRQDVRDKNRVWEAVLMYDPDRLARRYSYQELVTDELREAGVEVIFVTTPAPKNSEDKILHGVKGLFAEYERAKISERFRLGKLRKAKEGHILTSEPLYGYNYIRKNDKTPGYYEINEEEARVVRMMYKWVANEGLTIRAVIKRLKEMNIKPRKSKRGVWATSHVSKLLKHKGYIGEAHWGKTYAVVPEKPLKEQKYKKHKKTSRRDRPENEWYIIPIPVIIDQELYERARAQIGRNLNFASRNKKNEYLLSGILWCVCGRRRCGCSPMGGKHLYYRCNDRIHRFPLPPSCLEKGLNARVADDLVWKKVGTLISSPELLFKQAERWFNTQETKSEETLVDIKELEKEIAKLKDQEGRYNKAYGAGVFSLEQLKGYVDHVRERIGTIQSQISKTRQGRNQITNLGIPTKDEITSFTKEAAEVLNDKSLSFALKREIVLDTVEKVVGTQKELRVSGYIPVNHVLFCSEHRNRGSTKRGEVHAL